MKDLNMLQKAIEIMYYVHISQKDKSGGAQILHPMAVGLSCDTEEGQIVGFLHDVVEDSDWTFEDLHKAGFSDNVIDALKLLTHDKNVPYMDYVNAIAESGNRLAIQAKYHDLQNNLLRGKKAGIDYLVEKHSKAMDVIQKAYLKL